MSGDKYNPARDVTPSFLSRVFNWIIAAEEVLVVMRYLHAAGNRDFALIKSFEDFQQLVRLCPKGTDIIVFKDRQLPVRGKVSLALIEEAKSRIPDGTDYLFVRLTPEHPNDPRCFGEMGSTHRSLAEDLAEEMGEHIAVGVCPNWIKGDDDSMISAAKGGIDGPR